MARKPDWTLPEEQMLACSVCKIVQAACNFDDEADETKVHMICISCRKGPRKLET